MSKNKIEQIKDSFQQIIKEANIHSKKQQASFTGYLTADDAENKLLNNKDNLTKKGKNKSIQKNKKINLLHKTFEIKQDKKKNIKEKNDEAHVCTKKPSKKSELCHKNRSKLKRQVGQSSLKSFISVVDKRVDLKQLQGKSLLCLGGVRSGKSDFALGFANMFKGKKAFIATMQNSLTFQEESENQENGLNSSANNTLNLNKNIENNDGDVIGFLAVNQDERVMELHDEVKNTFRIHTLLDNDGQKTANTNNDVQNNFEAPIVAGEAVEREDVANPATDDFSFELDERILKHQKARDGNWITIEEPYNVTDALVKAKKMSCSVALIDCITLWISNLMLQNKTDEEIFEKIEELADKLNNPPLPVVMVSNEVGLGVVPDNAMARRFRDLQGKANQILAKDSQMVTYVVSGLPLLLKGRS